MTANPVTRPQTDEDHRAADCPLPRAASGLPLCASRRQALKVAGLGAGALALAACGSDSSSTPSSASSASSSSSGTGTAGGAAGSGGTGLVALADVPVGAAVSASDANGKPLIIAQPTAGTAVAFSALCPHQGCTVQPASSDLNCPCHGSRFNTTTGAVLNGPATKGLTEVPVTVKNGQVVAD
ncbi:Rieske (2Fe-2S) protein [Nakamurella endophytica]|nr:Rieske (2Fe-2S) protein [Nakamurella endophytica]